MYGKLFSSALDGSLATRGPWQAIAIWPWILALCDREGFLDMTAEVLSRRTTIPLEHVQTGLAALQAPDPYSRTPDADGRRLEPIADRPWGWRVVNYAKYRAIRSADERREYMRNYQAKRRERPEAGEVLERIPLKGGEEFEVRESFVVELDKLYPNVEPRQTLREIRGWCIGNPAKLKTRRGIRRCIIGWFKKEQDKHGRPR